MNEDCFLSHKINNMAVKSAVLLQREIQANLTFPGQNKSVHFLSALPAFLIVEIEVKGVTIQCWRFPSSGRGKRQHGAKLS